MPVSPKTYKPKRFGRATADRPRQSTAGRTLAKSWRWRKASKNFLRRPENARCRWPGCNRAAEVVDHIVRHEGDPELFWDEANNWQPLCAMHHNMKTAKEVGFGRKPAARG
jgi:5-methylcytosine-specific restriction endonuclease McrA